jgi:hypothetical protein
MRLLLALLLALPAIADSTNSQTGDLNTNQQAGGDISTNSGTVITQSAGSSKKTPPPSAIAPSYMSNGSDTCLLGMSGSVQSSIIGISGGKYVRDEFCEKLKLSKVLYDQGMKIGALTVLCGDERVFDAMFEAGTPCPITVKGKTFIGKMAYIYWERYPERRPNYDRAIHGEPSHERELLEELDEGSDSRSLSERFRSTRQPVK